MQKNITKKAPMGIHKIIEGIKALANTTFDFNIEKTEKEEIAQKEEAQTQTLSEESNYITDYEVLWPICVLLV